MIQYCPIHPINRAAVLDRLYSTIVKVFSKFYIDFVVTTSILRNVLDSRRGVGAMTECKMGKKTVCSGAHTIRNCCRFTSKTVAWPSSNQRHEKSSSVHAQQNHYLVYGTPDLVTRTHARAPTHRVNESIEKYKTFCVCVYETCRLVPVSSCEYVPCVCVCIEGE